MRTLRLRNVGLILILTASLLQETCFGGSPEPQPVEAGAQAATGSKIVKLPFKQIGDVTLRLHVHTPEGDSPRAGWPAIVFFYGGGWNSGNVEQFTPQAEHFARRGMVAIRAEYRVRSRHNVTPLECMADARSAMRWVRSHAAELKIDPARIAAAGGSAGGHLAACAAVFPKQDEGEAADVTPRPDALILFNPALDATETGIGAKLFGQHARAASPVHHLRPGMPPTIIMHGTADTTVPFANAETFQKQMRAMQARCELIPFEGRVHGFFNRGRSQKDHAATIAAADAFLVSLGWLGDPDGPERDNAAGKE